MFKKPEYEFYFHSLKDLLTAIERGTFEIIGGNGTKYVLPLNVTDVVPEGKITIVSDNKVVGIYQIKQSNNDVAK